MSGLASSAGRLVDSTSRQNGPDTRPLPFRARSDSDTLPPSPTTPEHDSYGRRKSASVNVRELRMRPTFRPSVPGCQEEDHVFSAARSGELPASPRLSAQDFGMNALTPPATPVKANARIPDSVPESDDSIIPYDFSKIDYEIDRARTIGAGLWSSVYFAQPIVRSPVPPPAGTLTPPTTPERASAMIPCAVYAVKLPARPDSKHVFQQEAKMLSRLQRHARSQRYIVPFYGLDARRPALVFEAVIGGSLDGLLARLRHMTALARHLELVGTFPRLALDLAAGLAFIHAAGVVHADIKPANVLLDIDEHPSRTRPAIRARYIDFSAAFVAGRADTAANAGGTWDYMAPEQLRIQRDLSTPTPASDVWSLGVTLLAVIVGGSPYAAAYGDNVFRLREAVKRGDPLGCARMEPVVQKRLATCQTFVDGLRLALQKDRERRTSAAAWRDWFEDRDLED